MAYNRGLFREAGVKEPPADWGKPWTWDEFREAMRRLTKSEGPTPMQVGCSGLGNWTTTVPVLWGTRWITDDNRSVVCDSQAMLDAYARYGDLLFKDRVMGQSPGVAPGADSFTGGKAATTMPCCSPLRFAKTTQGLNIDWAFMAAPKGTVSTLDTSPSRMGMARLSKQRNAAWTFLKFLDEKGRLATMEDRMPAALPDIAQWLKVNFAPWPTAGAEMLVEGVKVAKPEEAIVSHPQWQKMSQDVLAPGWKDVLAQKVTTTDFLRTVKPVLQQIVDEHERTRRK